MFCRLDWKLSFVVVESSLLQRLHLFDQKRSRPKNSNNVKY